MQAADENQDLRNFVQSKIKEYSQMPHDEMLALYLQHINAARAEYGDPPLKRLMTPEEIEAEYQARIHPPKNTFFRRLKKAWRVLTENDD